METSDSENFESADESFHSDTDEDNTIVDKLKTLQTNDTKPPQNSCPTKLKPEKVSEAPSTQPQQLDNTTKDTNKNLEPTTTTEEENMWDDDWASIDDAFKGGAANVIPEKKIGKLTSKYIPEEDVWETDGWEPLTNVEEPQKDNSWSTWGNWGVSSLISTATTLTSQVSQGLSGLVESGIGIPQPEELAKMQKVEREEEQEDVKNSIGFGLGNLVSGMSQITKIVETTGNKVITSGLDTLETIGKKTMEVLQEGDPGLKKKRAFLKIDQDKPVLSQLLREAKEKAETERKEIVEKQLVKKPNYETIFDDHQGLVHLEALEMLSKQCDIKLQTVIENAEGNNLKELQETLEQIRELCEIPEEDEEETLTLDDIKEKINTSVKELNVSISYEKLINSWAETDRWLNTLNMNVCSADELHQQAIVTLAQLTAISVEQFHKAGELMLIKEHRSTADEADSLVQLTTTLTSLIGIAAAKFSDKLNSVLLNAENKEEVNGLITNVFFEAANSSSYIQDAFQLLIPVLQVGAV